MKLMMYIDAHVPGVPTNFGWGTLSKENTKVLQIKVSLVLLNPEL